MMAGLPPAAGEAFVDSIDGRKIQLFQLDDASSADRLGALAGDAVAEGGVGDGGADGGGELLDDRRG